MVLFQVSTHFQLICAVIVKNQMLPDIEADLHLDDASDFSTVIIPIKESGIFRTVEISNQFSMVTNFRKEKGPKGLKQYCQLGDIWGFQEEVDYTDVYFGHDMIANKLYYYHLLKKGCRPKIHILDEGTATYYKDLVNACEIDGIDHEQHYELKYIENITEQLLYKPETYCLMNMPWEINEIPRMTTNTENMLFSIYGNTESKIPDYKYIFFACGGYESGFFLNELEMLDLLSEQVGKDNILIKKHPRYKTDCYSRWGYHVWDEASLIPLEILLIKNNTSKQVFVTVFSNAVFSPSNLFGRPQTILFLYEMILGGTRYGLFGKAAPKSKVFLERVLSAHNIDTFQTFAPKNKDELKHVLLYINGKMRALENE